MVRVPCVPPEQLFAVVSQRFVVISITACAAEHYAAWPRVLVSRLSLSSLLQMQQRVLAPLYIWWWWLPQRIVASLKRSGWGTWSGTTNLDAGRGGVRARELLERLFAAWWWCPTQLVSFWAGPNNIDVGGVAGQLEYAMNVSEHNGG